MPGGSHTPICEGLSRVADEVGALGTPLSAAELPLRACVPLEGRPEGTSPKFGVKLVGLAPDDRRLPRASAAARCCAVH